MPDNPDRGWATTLVGHLELETGEVVAVHVDDGSVTVGLYAMPDTEPADADALVTPAPAIALTADECESLGSLLAYAAVAAYGQRRPRLLRVVENSEDDEDGETND